MLNDFMHIISFKATIKPFIGWYIIAIACACLFSACDLKPLPDDLNPGQQSSFMVTDLRSAEGLRIVEQDDDYIIFNRYYVYRISKDNGVVSDFIDLRDTIPAYLFADVVKFQDGTMLVTSTNGGFTFLDDELSLFTSERNTPFNVVHSTFLDLEQEVVFIAPAEENSMIGPFIFFWPEGIVPDVFPFVGYTTHPINSVLNISPPNHLISETKAIYTLLKSGSPKPCSVACYTRSNPDLDWLTDFVSFCPRGFAAMSNGNILAYGLENGNTILYTLNGPNGSSLGFTQLCTGFVETPGEIVSTTDGGFVLVSVVEAINSGCTTKTINGANDIRLVKLNSSLAQVWEQVYNIALAQEVYHLIQTTDGGFAITGTTELNSIDQFLFIKTDEDGNLTP